MAIFTCMETLASGSSALVLSEKSHIPLDGIRGTQRVNHIDFGAFMQPMIPRRTLQHLSQ